QEPVWRAALRLRTQGPERPPPFPRGARDAGTRGERVLPAVAAGSILTRTARCRIASVAARDGGHVDLVAFGVGQGPPLGGVVFADHAAAGVDGRGDPRFGLVVRLPDVDV